MDTVGIPEDVRKLVWQCPGKGTSCRRACGCVQPGGQCGCWCCMRWCWAVHCRTVECIWWEGEICCPDAVQDSISGRDISELVPGLGDGTCEWRGQGRIFRAWRPSGGAEEDDTVAAQGFRICGKASWGPWVSGLDWLSEGYAAQLDRQEPGCRDGVQDI